MRKFYLGVDGGQSSTVALIADGDGRIIGQGRGGPCNHVAASEGRAKFFRAMRECLHQAYWEAEFDPSTQQFQAACLGFSGGAEDKTAYSKELINSRQYLITHDADIALEGAISGEPGIIVIAGTGSIAFGRNKQAQTARAGGWGYIFGDEGGAFDIVRQALRAALRMEEGWGEATKLHRILLAKTRAASAKELLHQFYAALDRTAIAKLAPLVGLAGAEGDNIAIKILHESANQLANLALGVSQSLFNQDQQPAVRFIGGVFESPLLLADFKASIQGKLNVEPAAPDYPPSAGALLKALRMDGNLSRLSDLPEVKR